MVQIGFIENNDLLKVGLTLYLNEHPKMNIVISAQTCEGLLENEDLNQLDVLIFDTSKDSDFVIIRELKERRPQLKLILLSDESRLAENYLFYQTSPTNAFLLKKIKLETLVDTILKLENEWQPEIILPESLREHVSEKRTLKPAVFTTKECTILSLIGKGKTNKETSEILNLSYRTIESHRRRMIEKLGCKNIIPVILYALEKNYIKVEPEEALFWDELEDENFL